MLVLVFGSGIFHVMYSYISTNINVMLLDIALHENKGDPAITIGEMTLIKRMNKTLVYYCDFNICKNNHLFCEDLYRKQTNLTMLLRDRHSLQLAEKHFAGQPKLILAPDMAFQIGPVRRFMKPFFDVLWIRRTDRERVGDVIPTLPTDITIRIGDWLGWRTPHTHKHMENAYLIANNGLVFLQRGRVVITDRLHGHILSTLLDIPHVILNNKWNKVSNYHNTWTKSLKNTRVANNASHAIDLARKLLIEYSDVLPEKVPFMDVNDVLN
ncbi:uncharacterized protein LOC126807697 [Patella vulgata]|uniref:uncharacterized protein LOC126807697 n=1 Tax=Patella vulgata TaxID=6465 RepID=UPI0021803B01|nr:uncharacterized protein LOC126807697 [Patella vulgata]